MVALPIPLEWLPHGEGLPLPEAQTTGAAGLDLCAAVDIDASIVIESGMWALIPCGFRMAIPDGYEGQVRPRSGLAAKFGVTVLNSPGTIDADYRGEVKVILINHGPTSFTISRGERIAQLVVAPVTAAVFELSTNLAETTRGSNGFGSTGQ